MNYFKGIFITLTIWLPIVAAVQAQDPKNTVVIPLKNDKYLSVQVCTDQIFRVRVVSKADFTETLNERYGILKTDWSPVKITSKKEKENRIIQTRGFQLTVNEETGELSVNDSNGKSIIQKIKIFYQRNEPVCKELGQSLEQYFGKEKLGGAIIGEANYKVGETATKKAIESVIPSLLQISLTPDERFYGGGSSSRKNIQHRGEALRMWVSNQRSEIPVPFVMSSNGWGIFNNTTWLNFFDIGRFQKDKFFVYNTSGDVDFYLISGNSMNEVIKQYTSITGKSYILPKWAYGLAFGGDILENQFNVMNDALRFRDEKIPCDMYWLEPQWMTIRYDSSTTQNWNLQKFEAEPYWEVKQYPKYESKYLFISKLHKMGFKLALWLCTIQDLTIEEEDHLAEKSGKQQSGLEHWFPHLTNFMDQGVDGFKLDPHSTLNDDPDRKYYNGHTDAEMHNLNQVLLQKQMYGIFREHKGTRSFQHYCGGYAGIQHWGASTSGDNGGGVAALFDQLNLGMSGLVNTSADVEDDNNGGIHMGFFLPWVQVNSWYGVCHPWYLSTVGKETFRFYAQLRNSLFPYIYSAAIEGSQSGMPIVRAMPLVFPNDRKVDNMINEYMFGENLLVGVYSDSIYLPKGNWINYWTGEKYTGEITIHCKIPNTRGGLLFIRGGAIIPYQKTMQFIGEYPMDTLILKVNPDKQSSYTLFEDDGKSFDFEKGINATTKFTCNESSEQIVFDIGATEGNYDKMPVSRVYKLELQSGLKPVKVLINGKPIEKWDYTNDGTIIIHITSKALEKQHIIAEFHL